MTKVRFTRSVTLEGIDYPLGSVHNISENQLKALERSVERLEASQPEVDADVVEEVVAEPAEEVVEEPAVEEHQDVTVAVKKLSLTPETDHKAVDEPEVNKMVQAAPKTKAKK